MVDLEMAWGIISLMASGDRRRVAACSVTEHVRPDLQPGP